MRQKLAQMWIDTEALKYTGARAITKLLKGELPGPEASAGKMMWVETHQRLQELAMEIEGPYSQLAQGSRLGGGRRRLAVHVPPLARQLDRGRHDRDPEEHHRRARARPPERLDAMDFGFNEEQELLRNTARKFLENECTSEFVRARMADAGGRHRRVLEEARRAGLARADLSRGVRRHGARLRGPDRAHGGDGPRGDARARSSPPCCWAAWPSSRRARRRRRRSGCRRSPAGAGQGRRSPGRSRARAGTPPASTLTAREAGRPVHAQRHQALRARRAHWPTSSWSSRARARGQAPRTASSLFLRAQGRQAGSTVKLLPTMDQTRKLCEVTLDDVAVGADALLGAAGAGWAPLARVLDRATVALCAEMCGGAQRCST